MCIRAWKWCGVWVLMGDMPCLSVCTVWTVDVLEAVCLAAPLELFEVDFSKDMRQPENLFKCSSQLFLIISPDSVNIQQLLSKCSLQIFGYKHE